MQNINLLAIIISFFSSIFFTLLIIKVAKYYEVYDFPKGGRKIHRVKTPLLGGLAIFFSFFFTIFLFRENVLMGSLNLSHWVGVFFGSLVLILGGTLDDKFNLSPRKQIIFPIIAILIVLLGGVEIEKITNPFGGFFYFNTLNIELFSIGAKTFYFTVLSDIFIFIWLLGMIYTTKLLDGLDGLVTGVTGIGAFVIFLFTISSMYYQPDIGFASLVLAFSCLGFLVFNWHPAKIFLGESGSLFLGFILGILAIISGGKIAIALLVMGIPILDVLWTIARRLLARKNPFKFSDRKHLHFRLYDLGLGQRKTVLIFYLLSFAFGLSALFLQSIGKFYALLILLFLMLSVVVGFGLLDKQK